MLWLFFNFFLCIAGESHAAIKIGKDHSLIKKPKRLERSVEKKPLKEACRSVAQKNKGNSVEIIPCDKKECPSDDLCVR